MTEQTEGNLPYISLVIVTFNQEKFVLEAIQGALSQDYSPLEIIVSDDCSCDDTFSIVEKAVEGYKGPHRIVLNRNEVNLGLADNINIAWELSAGELVLTQGGDDVSLPNRVTENVCAWMKTNPKPDLIFSATTKIDENGKVIGATNETTVPASIVSDAVFGLSEFVAGGCCAMYSRSVQFRTGPLLSDNIAEDFIYTFRAALGSGILGIPQALVLYRQTEGSMMGQMRSNKDNKIRNLIGRRVRLEEYRRALVAYDRKAPFLLFWLKRRINTFSIALSILQTNRLRTKVLWFLWIIVSFRAELLLRWARHRLKSKAT